LETSTLAESLSVSELANDQLQANVVRVESERDSLRAELDAVRKDMEAHQQRFREETTLLRNNAEKEKAGLVAKATTERNHAVQALRVELEGTHRLTLDEQHQRLVRDHESRLDSLREEMRAERKESYRERESMQERMLLAQEELRKTQTKLDAALEAISQIQAERDQLRTEALAAVKAQERLMGQTEVLRQKLERPKTTVKKKG
jgi:hypothetical protein